MRINRICLVSTRDSRLYSKFMPNWEWKPAFLNTNTSRFYIKACSGALCTACVRIYPTFIPPPLLCPRTIRLLDQHSRTAKKQRSLHIDRERWGMRTPYNCWHHMRQKFEERHMQLPLLLYKKFHVLLTFTTLHT